MLQPNDSFSRVLYNILIIVIGAMAGGYGLAVFLHPIIGLLFGIGSFAYFSYQMVKDYKKNKNP